MIIGYTLNILIIEAKYANGCAEMGYRLGMRIPSLYAKELNLRNEASVEIIKENGAIIIIPPKKTLEEMLSRATEANIHNSIESGISFGNEEW